MRALAFFLFPALELYLLVQAGSLIGALGVVAEVFASAALGIAVLRFQGRQTLSSVQEELHAGRMPQDLLLDNLLVFFAGILLIVPGLLSDTLGLLLLVSPLRTLFRLRLVAWLTTRQSAGSFRSGSVFIYRSGDLRQEDVGREEGDDGVIDISAEPPAPASDEDARKDERS